MVNSMTAYASFDLQQQNGRARWEMKSINHRFLDLTFKLPERFRSIEPTLREIAKQQLHRGKVECWLQWESSVELSDANAVNQNLVKQLASACQQINTEFQEQFHYQTTLSPIEILKWPNVFNSKENTTDTLSDEMMDAFKSLVDRLVSERAKEGIALSKIMLQKLDEMERITQKIKARQPFVLQQQRGKILERLKDLKSELNTERLEQEMLYFAQKIDITEEVDRLLTHIQSSKNILKKGGIVGRQLDFLMQELNREANTLSSKSTDIDIIQMGVEIKMLIEQIREQVQNLE